MKYPDISVVIPVKNEEKNIAACIDGILSQSISVIEIIVIDSGSTDNTLNILRSYPLVNVIHIPTNEFNHGDTRNLGIRHAKGEFVLFTVGDARASNNQWIEELLKGFTEENVAAVCGQQIVPHEVDKNPVQWFRPVSEPQIIHYYFATPNEFESLPPETKKSICSWDNVTAIYRGQALKKIPFRSITYGEDSIWSKDAILNGYKIAYSQNARVYHYHNENPEFVIKRTFSTMYFLYSELGYLYSKPPELSFVERLRLVKVLVQSLGLSSSVVYWYQYNIRNRNAVLKAYRYFFAVLKSGHEELRKKHLQICNLPPIPQKS